VLIAPDSAAEDARGAVFRDRRSADRGDDGLRQQHSVDIISGRAVKLNQRVESWKIAGSSKVDLCNGRVGLGKRYLDGRVVLLRSLDRIAKTHRRLSGRERGDEQEY
jgi:hypothetical protein